MAGATATGGSARAMRRPLPRHAQPWPHRPPPSHAPRRRPPQLLGQPRHGGGAGNGSSRDGWRTDGRSRDRRAAMAAAAGGALASKPPAPPMRYTRSPEESPRSLRGAAASAGSSVRLLRLSARPSRGKPDSAAIFSSTLAYDTDASLRRSFNVLPSGRRTRRSIAEHRGGLDDDRHPHTHPGKVRRSVRTKPPQVIPTFTRRGENTPHARAGAMADFTDEAGAVSDQMRMMRMMESAGGGGAASGAAPSASAPATAPKPAGKPRSVEQRPTFRMCPL